MVYRSVVSCLLLALYLNKNLKNVMFDSVKSDSVPGLVVRTLTGNVAIFINFMSVKYFPLTTVAMMINCAPILTLILVVPILDEKVKLKDVICVIAAFLAIGLVILGNESVE
jgi:drug/metabolite transporter (DMT)-like permease